MLKMSNLPFPEGGMPCLVLGCTSELFSKYRQMVFHWKKFQEPVVTLYRCESCQRFFGHKGDAQQHLKRHHRLQGTPWTKKKKLFIPPGAATLPRPNQFQPVILQSQPNTYLVSQPPAGWPPQRCRETAASSTSDEEEVRRVAREEAAEERRRIAENAKNSPLYALANREMAILLPEDNEEVLCYL